MAIDENLIEIIKLDTESMYKLFYSLCEQESTIRIVKYGHETGLEGIEIHNLINPPLNKPKNPKVYLQGKFISREEIRTEIEARTKLMVNWFMQNMKAVSLTTDRSEADDYVNEKGIDFSKIGAKTQ